MSRFDVALEVYRSGRLLIDETRELAVTNFELRWAREDLEDTLLDVKVGVIDLNDEMLATNLQEAVTLILKIAQLVDDLQL